MKKKLTAWMMCFIVVFAMFSVTAHADTGPKPSVQITFENMGDEVCYGTLLSKTDSTGPASAWDGNPEHIYNYGLDMDIWQAFVDYKDADGYYFLQEGWLCSENKELNWTYYPLSSFKILLYYPEQDTYTVSEICERYAFDSYFRVTMDGLEIKSVDDNVYDFTWELVSLACRVLITIALELAVAWLFGLRQKKLITGILGVNVITQIALNVALNIINYSRGAYMFVFCYILLEILVFIVEAVAYVALFRRNSEKRISNERTVVYALVANIVSFVGGMAIAQWVPGIF